MFEFNSQWYKPDILITKLSEKLDTKPTYNFLETICTLDARHGKGKIRGFEFRNGISLLLFQLELNDDWRINFINHNPPPLQMTYFLEGSATYEVENFKKVYEVSAMESSIVSCPMESKQSVTIPANKKVTFAILQINKAEYFGPYYRHETVSLSKVKDVFLDVYGEIFFSDLRPFDLNTASKLNLLFLNDSADIANLIIAEAIIFEIISQQIRYISNDKVSMTKRVNLSENDLNNIKSAKKILEKEYTDPPTIVELARRVGINQQKLKVAFKKVYGITIKTLVIKLRMEKAAESIASGKSVAKAMESVGYTNQGHFSKRFKEAYGVLPKDYRKKTGVHVSQS